MKPSDVSNLLQQVVEEINENEFHPLHRFCSYNYYTDFFSMAEILFAHGYFNTQKERKSFFNRMQFNNGICPPTDYDKIDVVYLTALVTGHTKPKDTYNSWKLSSYCNLLCKNPFSRKYQNGFYEGYKSALELFPNSTSCFEEFYSGVSESADKAQRPLQGLMFPTFFDEYFPYLWR